MAPSTVRLKRLAEEATPGPWFQEKYPIDGSMEPMPQIHNEIEEIAATTYRRKSHDQHIVDAAYIAAANPEAVLGLIARIEKLEAALQFYADPRTYEGGHNDDVGSTGIDIDYRGNTAREALKDEADEPRRGES